LVAITSRIEFSYDPITNHTNVTRASPADKTDF